MSARTHHERETLGDIIFLPSKKQNIYTETEDQEDSCYYYFASTKSLMITHSPGDLTLCLHTCTSPKI